MSTSLRSLRGGNFGFGVRPMRGALTQARTKNYPARSIVHPSIPNVAFFINAAGSSLTVYGSDGNVAGTALPATLIDGTNQRFHTTFELFTPGDGYFWTLVFNAENEFRLVRANASGAITTVGAKFSVTTASNWSNQLFCYENGGNIVLRVGVGFTAYQHVVSKASGQIVSQNTVVTTSGGDYGHYVTADGSVTLNQIVVSNEDTVAVMGLSLNGTVLPAFNIDANNFFGVALPTTVNGAHYYVTLAGTYVCLLSGPTDNNAQTPFPLIERVEFDRWLKDVVNKFKYV